MTRTPTSSPVRRNLNQHFFSERLFYYRIQLDTYYFSLVGESLVTVPERSVFFVDDILRFHLHSNRVNSLSFPWLVSSYNIHSPSLLSCSTVIFLNKRWTSGVDPHTWITVYTSNYLLVVFRDPTNKWIRVNKKFSVQSDDTLLGLSPFLRLLLRSRRQAHSLPPQPKTLL